MRGEPPKLIEITKLHAAYVRLTGLEVALDLHWNWIGRAHWLCVFLPEWPNDRGQR